MIQLVGPRTLRKKGSSRRIQQQESTASGGSWVALTVIIILAAYTVGYHRPERSLGSSAGAVKNVGEELSKITDSSAFTSSAASQTSKKVDSTTTSICSPENGLGKYSTLQLWIRHASKVHASSRLHDDIDYIRHDFTAELLALITPRLEYSVKTLTKDWNLVAHLLKKFYKRYRYLLKRKRDGENQTDDDDDFGRDDSQEEVPPPLRIAVMGGSVTLGIQCKTGIPGHPYHDSTTKYCAWPHRLESFVNEYFGIGQLIEVHNEGVGATNTDVGNTILRYNVIPGILENSDILINSYSTNDAGHAARNSTKFFATMQEFCRLVLEPPRQQRRAICQFKGTQTSALLPRRPLLIHIDDVLPPYYTPIQKHSALPRLVSTLAAHYGFLSLSYADMVRDYVYGDPKETWFSADEFPKGSYHYDIHPGQAMHISMAWMVAYALLQLATAYCTYTNEFWTLQSLLATDQVSDQYGDKDKMISENRNTLNPGDFNWLSSYNRLPQYDETVLFQAIPLFHNGTDQESEGIQPQLPEPQGLLPSLDTKVTISEVHSGWMKKSEKLHEARNRQCPTTIADASSGKDGVCPFSWVTGHDQSKNASWVEANVLSRMTEESTWVLETHYTFRKMGLTPPMGEIGATVDLEFELSDAGGPIRTLVIFYLKSYGKNWEESTARIGMFEKQTRSSSWSYDDRQWRQLAQKELNGHHDKDTSEMYAEIFSWDNEADHGIEYKSKNGAAGLRTERNNTTYKVQAKLVRGQTFKIMGLALCQF